jgi:hypothetical protein
MRTPVKGDEGPSPRKRSPNQTKTSIFLALSTLLNMVLIFTYIANPINGQVPERSKFGQCLFFALVILYTTEEKKRSLIPSQLAYLHHCYTIEPQLPINTAEHDTLWASTSYDRGNIALSDTYAGQKGLLRAQLFPWDTSKGIYLINPYHNLHCVKMSRRCRRRSLSSGTRNSKLRMGASCALPAGSQGRDQVQCGRYATVY